MLPRADASIDPIVQRLHGLVQEWPDLEEAARIYETILPILGAADLHVVPISLTPDEACVKMRAGLPVLNGLELELDWKAAHELLLRLAYALELSGKESKAAPRIAAARSIRLAFEGNRTDSLLQLVAEGRRDAVKSTAQSLALDGNLLWTLTRSTLKPALRAWCRQATTLIGRVPWDRGACFVCGATAVIGELQGNALAKHLRCGECGADWLFHRLQCMYCGNEDHRSLGYLYAEDRREKARVELCDKCSSYLKVITTFAPTPPEMLPVEDLATLYLDYIAQDRGYERRTILQGISPS